MNYIDSHAYVWSNDKPLTLNSNIKLIKKEFNYTL